MTVYFVSVFMDNPSLGSRLDGAGQLAAIKRFTELKNPQKLIIGR
jgi:hypothetical protein